MASTQAQDQDGLDVQVERTGPCTAKVRFTVSAAAYQKARAIGLKNYASRTKLKGFRPGKVPPSFVEKHFGPEVDKQLVEHFVQTSFQRAVQENELRPASSPRIDFEKIEASTEADWGHEFEVLVRPDVELGRVTGLKAEGQPVAITDEEYEQALLNLNRELSIPEPAGDEGLPKDGMAVSTLTFGHDDHEEPVLETGNIRLGPVTPPMGIDAEEFEKEMTGLKVGEHKTFQLTFPDDFPKEEVRGQEGSLTIRVDECYRIVPPEEGRLRTEFGVEDDEALEKEIRKRMLESKQSTENQRIEQVLLEQVIEAHPIEIPEPIVNDQADLKVAEIRQALEEQGMQGEELETQLVKEREAALDNAAQAMRAIYLMEEIARANELMVSPEDLEEEFTAIAARNGVERTEVRKYYQQENLLQQLGLELLERKVRSFLRESADIQVATPAD